MSVASTLGQKCAELGAGLRQGRNWPRLLPLLQRPEPRGGRDQTRPLVDASAPHWRCLPPSYAGGRALLRRNGGLGRYQGRRRSADDQVGEIHSAGSASGSHL